MFLTILLIVFLFLSLFTTASLVGKMLYQDEDHMLEVMFTWSFCVTGFLVCLALHFNLL